MRLDRLITLYLVHPLMRLCRRELRANDRRLPILMYHSVSDDPEPGVHPYYRVCTSPKRFAAQMQWLRAAGYRGVTLREGLAWLQSPPEIGNPKSQAGRAKLVSLTFDDGFRDFYTNAFPVLQQCGFSATMYLPTALIRSDNSNREPQRALNLPTPCNARAAFGDKAFLSWNEIRELHVAGIEFGSHTVHHPRLSELSCPQISFELRHSKFEIEAHLGAKVSAFAHPYAFPQEDRAYVDRLTGLLRDSGYTNAVTTRIGCARKSDSLFTLRRLPANELDDRPLFAAKLLGAYDWLAGFQFTTRRLKRRFGTSSAPSLFSPRQTRAVERMRSSRPVCFSNECALPPRPSQPSGPSQPSRGDGEGSVKMSGLESPHGA